MVMVSQQAHRQNWFTSFHKLSHSVTLLIYLVMCTLSQWISTTISNPSQEPVMVFTIKGSKTFLVNTPHHLQSGI